MKPPLSSLMAIVLCAGCSDIPTPFGHARIVGGKGGLYYNADGSMSYVFNQVQSFQHFMQMLSLAITQGLSALVDLEKQTTAQLLNGEITKREASARLAEIEKAKIGLQGQAIEKVAPGTGVLTPIAVKPVGP